ncbi:MAG: hypothetical protein KKF02_11620 [Proteobacteria bacterium]|nr:hypothetical protein [Pseudomonadota bacterium]
MMMSVTVGELLAFRERLGMTQVAGPLGCLKPVGNVFMGFPEGDGLRSPVSRSVLILSPAFPGGGVSAWCDRLLVPALMRDIACAAVAEAQQIPEYLRDFSERAGTPVFASRYPASLLESRLAGLLREIGERKTMVHGVLLRISGLGVLIMGESGIGKTACGLNLAARGHAWVADDAVVLEGRGTVLYGRGHDKTRNWIAPRGRGILRAEALLGKKAICEEVRVDLIVHFVGRSGKGGADEGGDGISVRRIAGIGLPCRRLATGADAGSMAGQVLAVVGELRVQ